MSKAKILTPEERREHTARLIHSLGGVITPRELARHSWRFRQVNVATSLLESMVSANLGTWVDLNGGPKGGRPSRKFVLCNSATAGRTHGGA